MAIDDSGKWWVGSEAADIREYLSALTRSEGGYPTNSYKPVLCVCGCDRFNLARASNVTRRACTACGTNSFICRDKEDWDEAEAEESAEQYACIECESNDSNLMVGFARYDDNPEIDGIKWFYVGVRCVECGILSCFNDGKIGWGPASEVFETV